MPCNFPHASTHLDLSLLRIPTHPCLFCWLCSLRWPCTTHPCKHPSEFTRPSFGLLTQLPSNSRPPLAWLQQGWCILKLGGNLPGGRAQQPGPVKCHGLHLPQVGRLQGGCSRVHRLTALGGCLQVKIQVADPYAGEAAYGARIRRIGCAGRVPAVCK